MSRFQAISAEDAEGRACLMGLQAVANLGLQDCQLQLDNQNIVDFILERKVCPAVLVSLLEDVVSVTSSTSLSTNAIKNRKMRTFLGFGRIFKCPADDKVLPLLKPKIPAAKQMPPPARRPFFSYAMLSKLLNHHADEVLPLLKLKMAVRKVAKQIPAEPPHWAFCHTMLPKVSTGFALLISQIDADLRDAVYMPFHLVLDRVPKQLMKEDDMSIDAEVKVPILLDFYRHIHDRDWHFSSQDLQYGENSAKAVQCLNEMVTDSLIPVEDCFKFLSTLQNPNFFRFWAFTTIVSMGRLATYYNNIDVFRCHVDLRPGLTAKIIDATKSMADVEDHDPNATKTRGSLESILKACHDSETLDKRFLRSS
ncbi:OLC1v1002266C1 [Oldenlandia corymbosa var. corymbosa]|uniref:OLC1v1002266C1 n=1 Tax=Oldenlandia corymbosa var. corymbosa TaxID=529605 RepID=A0AAV1D7Z8_OLDCO|nr:OLC1v1002266C1 [Oldenlandia corymbosa var. corymbosa]